MPHTLHLRPLNDANRLGLVYETEASRLPWPGPITDVHTHLESPEAADRFRAVARRYGVGHCWTMSPLEIVDALRERHGDWLTFIAVPNHRAWREPGTFTIDWMRRIEAFAEKGARVAKFWTAPRSRDMHPALALDHPVNREARRLAREAGMIFMTHVADPDTWFASHYADARRYGTKAAQYGPLERALDQTPDVPWIAAHMAGHPEDLDHVHRLLERHPNLHVDTSATKWQVRELSRHPERFTELVRAHPGRVLFGSDLVAGRDRDGEDYFASRYWALRTFLETDYRGPSPIVDPDLALLDPGRGPHPTAELNGASLDPASLAELYGGAAEKLLRR